MPEVARTLDEALALQGADVAAQVVGKGFVEAVGGRSRAAGIDIEVGRRFQPAERIVGEAVGLPLAAAHAPGHLRDVAALLQRAAQATDRAAGRRRGREELIVAQLEVEQVIVFRVLDQRRAAGAGHRGGAGSAQRQAHIDIAIVVLWSPVWAMISSSNL